MPHGSRLNAQGTKHYSACMMDDMLVEIDTRELGRVAHFHAPKGPGARDDGRRRGMRRAALARPRTMPAATAWSRRSPATCPARRRGRSRPPTGAGCSWRATRPARSSEIDVAAWTLTRRIPAGDGVYNLAVTHDGKLLVGDEQARPVGLGHRRRDGEGARADADEAEGGARRRRSPGDDRYAFISVEGIGSEPGTVEVIDLRALATVATVDVGQMAGGIDVLPAAR